MPKSNRRSFIGKGAATAAAAATIASGTAEAQGAAGSEGLPPAGRKVWLAEPKASQKPSLYSPAVSFGNLLFLSGVGAHFEGDIKAHTKHVLDEIQQRLEACGSSMNNVLKAQVFLADLKDYDGMNEAFRGRFGAEPPVRTTVSVAGLPGKSLVEIDVVAFL